MLSRSLGALLAFIQSSVKSIEALVLLLLEMAAIGEMLAGISSREASPSSMLAWDEASADSSTSSGLCGRDVRTTAVVSILGGDCWVSQLDTSNTAWDRRLLTCVVILLLGLGGDLGGLVTRTVGMSSRGSIFLSGSSMGGKGISISKLIMFALDEAYTTAQQIWYSGYNGFILSVQTYGVDDLRTSSKQLLDF